MLAYQTYVSLHKEQAYAEKVLGYSQQMSGKDMKKPSKEEKDKLGAESIKDMEEMETSKGSRELHLSSRVCLNDGKMKRKCKKEVTSDMSFDTAKENESVVDSSVTEFKHGMEHVNNQESRNNRGEDVCRSESEDQGHSCDQVGNSIANKNKLHGSRYFIIKSLNHQNIQLSIANGIWATQVMNEPILDEAYHNSGKVILIFSVNMSGFFQGYAQMMSSVGWRRDNVWSQGSSVNKPWGRSFKVKWLRLQDLPFQKTLHLKNPLNDFKPVKISRDCQELPQDVGEALCELFDEEIDVDHQNMDNFLPKRSFTEPLCSLQGDEDCFHPGNVALFTTPLLYPSLLYQQQSEASRYQVAQQRSMNSCIKANHTNVRLGWDNTRFNRWGLSAALTEDDILEMTYEEYVEAYNSINRRFHQPVNESSRRAPESSASKESSDDINSRPLTRKRTHHDQST